MVPDIVDLVVFHIFNAIDEGSLRLKYVSSSGREVDLTEVGLGELGGWYMGGDGFRERYAKERFVDDFAALRGR